MPLPAALCSLTAATRLACLGGRKRPLKVHPQYDNSDIGGGMEPAAKDRWAGMESGGFDASDLASTASHFYDRILGRPVEYVWDTQRIGVLMLVWVCLVGSFIRWLDTGDGRHQVHRERRPVHRGGVLFHPVSQFPSPRWGSEYLARTGVLSLHPA